MDQDRPQVPKKIAAKLRAAYTKVGAQRDRLAHAEALIEDCQHLIDEYEDDPIRFADLNYPGHGVHSYPVQTKMERTRENLSYRLGRMAVYIADVASAELHKVEVEREIIKLLEGMRPGTPGRVDWPQEPRSLDSLRKGNRLEFEKNRRKSKAFTLKREKIRFAEAEKRRIDGERALQEANESMEFKFSLMSPMRAAAERAYWEAIKAALSKPDFSLADMSALANGDEKSHQVILDDALGRFKEAIGHFES